MANPTYLSLNTTTGVVDNEVATETGPAANAIVSTNSGGTIDPSLLPASEAATATAGEAISAGAFVYIKASDGKLYNAVWSSGGNQAIGFTLASYASLATATYYPSGQNTALTGLTQGARYYGLPGTAGAVTSTPPSTAGQLFQYLGTAVSTTAIEANITDYIQL